MANHKRKRPKNRRGGCLACKRWKVNGVGDNKDTWRFSDWVRREGARLDEQAYFWTPEWQAGEAEVDRYIAEGNYETFDSMDEFLATLEEVTDGFD